MTTTRVDVSTDYSVLPSGCADSSIFYWSNIKLSDDQLNEAMDELQTLTDTWVEKWAVNKADFKED